MDQGQQDPEPTLAELRWRSRRGTRELDLILLGFLSASYENLTPQDRRTYARLLDASDPDLTTWLFGRATPDDLEIAKLVQAMAAILPRVASRSLSRGKPRLSDWYDVCYITAK